MSAQTALISIIIPHLNQAEHLRRCLSSINEQTDVSHLVEIIVVDNGSAALPGEICGAYDNVRLEQESEPGPGPARNKGVAVSRGAVLAFIDADCIARPGWIAAIIGAFGKDNAHQILGGDVRIAINDPARLTLLEAYESIFAYRQKEYIEKQGFSGAGNLAMRRECFDRVGHFAAIHLAEDRDWGQRASKLGDSITYVPEMIVFHPARKSFAELYAKWDRHINHDFEEYTKKSLGRVRWVFYVLAVAASPIFEMRRILISSRVPTYRDKWFGALGLIRIRFYRVRRMLQLLFNGAHAEKNQSWNKTEI